MTRQPNARGSGDALRTELVAAASELLLAPQSIALPSLRAVARSCNVSPAAVYLHFASQQELISAVIDTQLARLREHIDRALASGPAPDQSARDQLNAFAAAYLEWGLRYPGAYQLLFEASDRLGIQHPDPQDDADRWYLLSKAAELVHAVNPELDRELVAVRLWTGLHGLVSLRIHKPGNPWPDLEREVDHVITASL